MSRNICQKDAAALLKISIDTLDRRQRDDPTFPKCYRIGRIKILNEDELIAWQKNKRRK